MSHLSRIMREKDLSKHEVYTLVAEGAFAIEDFDLHVLEEMISLGYLDRNCVNEYFAHGRCSHCGG